MSLTAWKTKKPTAKPAAARCSRKRHSEIWFVYTREFSDASGCSKLTQNTKIKSTNFLHELNGNAGLLAIDYRRRLWNIPVANKVVNKDSIRFPGTFQKGILL